MLGYAVTVTRPQPGGSATPATKRELAAREWRYVQDYADAKGQVVEGILARAAAASTQSRRRLPASR